MNRTIQYNEDAEMQQEAQKATVAHLSTINASKI